MYMTKYSVDNRCGFAKLSIRHFGAIGVRVKTVVFPWLLVATEDKHSPRECCEYTEKEIHFKQYPATNIFLKINNFIKMLKL